MSAISIGLWEFFCSLVKKCQRWEMRTRAPQWPGFQPDEILNPQTTLKTTSWLFPSVVFLAEKSWVTSGRHTWRCYRMRLWRKVMLWTSSSWRDTAVVVWCWPMLIWLRSSWDTILWRRRTLIRAIKYLRTGCRRLKLGVSGVEGNTTENTLNKVEKQEGKKDQEVLKMSRGKCMIGQ